MDSISNISDFHDNILHHILSFLPAKQVVQTCLLSKRWTDLWCSAHSLNLVQDDFPGCTRFIKFNDLVLLLRGGSSIQSLRLDCEDPYMSINNWILVAIRHNIQVLDINIRDIDEFKFTPRLFRCSSLRVLKLQSSLPIHLPYIMNLPNLEQLFFRDIIFEDDQFIQFFSSCLSLQILYIDQCTFSIETLTISRPQLKNLIIKGSIPSLEISTPGLISFEINLEPPGSSVLFSLARLFEDECEEDGLTIRVQKPFINLKLLKVVTYFNDNQAKTIHRLLKLSPNIETLVLTNIRETELPWQEEIDVDVWPEYKLSPHLKSVKFQNYKGCLNEKKFVRFLLNRAENLEKLNIVSKASLTSASLIV